MWEAAPSRTEARDARAADPYPRGGRPELPKCAGCLVPDTPTATRMGCRWWTSQWATGRGLVSDFGWGARLLSLEDEDGQWAGAAFVPASCTPARWEQVGRPWTATAFTLDVDQGPGEMRRRGGSRSGRSAS